MDISIVTGFTGLITEYGPMVALVAYIMWENSKREAKAHERENEFINETRVREKNFVKREEVYVSMIKQFSESFTRLEGDVSEIKEKLFGKGSGLK